MLGVITLGLALSASASAQGRFLGLDNGTLAVLVDLESGGAIAWLSRSGTLDNLVNIHDRGRYIQQSYYAGNDLNRQAQGQSPSWSPWPWNPIQVGDYYGHSSRILESSDSDGTLYVKTRPLLWDMNNEEGQCDFETWVTLKQNVVRVRNRITCFRTDSLWPTVARNQELPAVYTISRLNRLFTYQGESPWTGAPLTEVPNNGSPWVYWNTPEHWAAHVDSNNWGVGVYNRNCTLFAGGLHGTAGGNAASDSTGYISPINLVTLDKTTTYEYSYNLIVGTLDQIRDFASRMEVSSCSGNWTAFE
jgi:hypothetical protein